LNIISLIRELLSFNKIDTPGNKSEIANFVGDLLAGLSFNIKYPLFEENHLHLMA
jgi:hypothetical protein